MRSLVLAAVLVLFANGASAKDLRLRTGCSQFVELIETPSDHPSLDVRNARSAAWSYLLGFAQARGIYTAFDITLLRRAMTEVCTQMPGMTAFELMDSVTTAFGN